MAQDPVHVELTGPWSCAFALRVPLALRSKSNFRRHRGRVADAGSWESSQNFERSLSVLARSARPPSWIVGEREAPVAQRPIVVAFIAARSTIDVANYSKSTLDACQNVLYVSDASVLAVLSQGTRGHGDELLLGFAQLSSTADVGAVNHAVTKLSEEALAAFPDVI
jgi:Holliday junction resolvase RusA-like endonuclease